IGKSVFYAYFFQRYRKEAGDTWIIATAYRSQKLTKATVFEDDGHKGERLWDYEEPLRHMMDHALRAHAIDLSTVWKAHGGEEIMYDAIALNFGIIWGGTVFEAKLFVPPDVQHMILSSVYPLRDLLEKVTPAISNISINHADELELCFLKRFQELFYEKHCPKNVLPNFFTE
ncbi:hypothetical protein PHYPSEUDO_012230, partial [Phytophthora pseudosyringae]